MSIKGKCLCGAVTFTYHGEPRFLVDCNCTACRRYATLWAHDERSQLELNAPKDGLISFRRDDETLTFHSCTQCGCTTHWTSTDPAENATIAINARMADPTAIAHLSVRKFDGLDSWTFLD